jgi:hypothetical protein
MTKTHSNIITNIESGVPIDDGPKVRVQFRSSMTQAIEDDPWTPWMKILKAPALENIKSLKLHPKKNIEEWLDKLPETVAAMEKHLPNITDPQIKWWNDKIEELRKRQNKCDICNMHRKTQRENAYSKNHSAPERKEHGQLYSKASQELQKHLTGPDSCETGMTDDELNLLRKKHCWPLLETARELKALKDFGRTVVHRAQLGNSAPVSPPPRVRNRSGLAILQPKSRQVLSSPGPVTCPTDRVDIAALMMDSTSESESESESRPEAKSGPEAESGPEAKSRPESSESCSDEEDSQQHSCEVAPQRRANTVRRSLSNTSLNNLASIDKTDAMDRNQFLRSIPPQPALHPEPDPVSPAAVPFSQASGPPHHEGRPRSVPSVSDLHLSRMVRSVANDHHIPGPDQPQAVAEVEPVAPEPEPPSHQMLASVLVQEPDYNKTLAAEDEDLMEDISICLARTTATDSSKKITKIKYPLKIGHVVAMVFEDEQNQRKWCVAKLMKWDLEEANNYAGRVKPDNSHQLKEMWWDPDKEEWAAMGGRINRPGGNWWPQEDWVSKEAIVWWTKPEKVITKPSQNKTWKIYKLSSTMIRHINNRLERFEEVRNQIETERNKPRSMFSAEYKKPTDAAAVGLMHRQKRRRRQR